MNFVSRNQNSVIVLEISLGIPIIYRILSASRGYSGRAIVGGWEMRYDKTGLVKICLRNFAS
jgi:hypothetical protein